jgi:FKBP-type peptidyl-prolyl cis-trans isomerase FklB
MATENQVSLCSDEQKVSYGLGRQFGDHLQQTCIKGIDLEAVIAGLEQAYLGQDSVISADAMEAAYQSIEIKLKAAAKDRAARALEEGEEFFARNSRRNNVVTLASGLQYEILEKGAGPIPGPRARVRTHYQGALLDGTVFDSSIARGEPAEFAVNQVIPGWSEALQLMPQHSRWKLWIPSSLAYGEQGAGAEIPPHAALVFEVTLLEVLDS